MNKQDIITRLYKDSAFKRICCNISPPDYSGDLFHETILTLLEMSDEKILDAHTNNYLKFLFLKIASNQWNSTTSPFFKKYRHNEPTDDVQDFEVEYIESENEYEIEFDNLVNKIEQEVDSIPDEYDRELVILYLVHQDFRKVSDLVGIKYTSVRHTINQALNKIKQNNEELFNAITRSSGTRICTKRIPD